GVVVESLGWPWVFHGVALLAVPSALLIVWATRHGEDRAQVTAAEDDGAAPVPVLPPPARRSPRAAMTARLILAAGAGTGVAAVSVGSSSSGPARVGGLSVGAGLVVVLGLRWLPRGTVRPRPGLPALVGVRGLMAAAFFGAEVYLPLILQHERGLSP